MYFLYRRFYFKYGIQIPLETIISPAFCIGHFGNMAINSGAVIGSKCNISNGVTVGQTNRGNFKGIPYLGNNVWIGVNYVFVGNIKKNF